MPATKRGIYHNLKESKYTISNGEIVFFFSSKLYLKKFIGGYKKNRDNFKYIRIEEESPLNLSTLADISFYKEIEKRGFRASLKGMDITWDDLNKYALRKMTEKESDIWEKIVPPKVGGFIGKG